MTHKIAIITTKDVYSNYGDDCNTVINNITEWTEVSDEDFRLLQQAAYKMPYGQQFVILEQPIDTPAFIAKTIADYIKLSKQEEAREAAEKKKKAADALARKYKKELKDVESKKKLFEKLKAELGTDAT
jgi:hypothetical protein